MVGLSSSLPPGTDRNDADRADRDRTATDRDRRARDVLSTIADQAKLSNRARAEVIAGVFAQLPDTAPDQLEVAVRSAHQLAGSAGTFGMPSASRLARRLERFLTDAGFHDGPRLSEARQDLVELQRVLAAG